MAMARRPKPVDLITTKGPVVDETSLKSLLEHLPVSWWEADRELRVIDSGGGAFDDTVTAQRFLDTVRKELAGPAETPEISHWQAQFDGRVFDVNWPLGVPRQGRSRGLAVEVGPQTAGPRRYDAFADLAPAAAFIRDATGRYLWANHAYAHLYGTTPEHIIGKDVADVDGPADAAQVLSLDREVLERGKPVRHTLTYHRFDGTGGRAVGHRFPYGKAASGVWRASTSTSATTPARCASAGRPRRACTPCAITLACRAP